MPRLISVLILAFALSAAPPQDGAAYFNNGGSIALFSSSHQDIAWMDSPQACMLFRLNQCILPALDLMAKDKNYTFVMENMLNLEEVLENRPGARAAVERAMRDGQLEWGATYNQPYEDLLSGEELIREAYFGRRWLKRAFPGTDAKVAFNPDVPGRSLQMSQILAKSGIPYLIISRYHAGLYRWFSPDGSSVLAYTPGHYTVPLQTLGKPVPEAIPEIRKMLEQEGPRYEKFGIPPVLPLLNSEDFSKPKDFGPLLAAWNAQGSNLPVLRYSTARRFFEDIDKPEAHFPALHGARPDIWLYIGGPTHHWAISAKREAAYLLPAAETFATVRSLLDGNFRAYPAQRLSDAWKAEIYPDHGWGGKNGHITDILFKEKAEFAGGAARAELKESLGAIAARIRPAGPKGTPIVLFNALSWKRSDPVRIDAAQLPPGPWRIVDEAGKEAPYQLTRLENPEEIDVALGARATADSSAGPDLGPERAIDGKWSHMETERWISGPGAGPHWLAIDFGRPRNVHEIMLRHEGSLGAFQDTDEFNTTDFQVQWAASPQGPWKDLVAPVRGNADVLTVHRFAPKAFRYLRIYVTRSAQKADQPARLFEVQAFEKVPARAGKLVFIAADVPPVGYKTYYIVAGKPAAPAPALLENEYYRIALAPGGIQSIFDKNLQRELLDTSKFLGGEVFTMQSVGNGAGEFGAVQQPTIEGFDQMSRHKPEWRQVETGPVRTVMEFSSDWPGVTIRQRLVLYHGVKRLDSEVALLHWQGAKYREFRMAWPMNAPQGQVAYEVPMGVIEVGKTELQTTGGHAYGTVDYSGFIPEIRPREVRDFINVSDDQIGVTLSSDVAVFDFKDPTTSPVPYPVIQPILLASRKSCHGEGNWYLQPGDHYFRFSLTSQAPGWRNGYKPALQANQPLLPVVSPQQGASPSLPAEKSFFSLSADNLVLSTIKKSEEGDAVVLRFYDMEGRDSQTSIQTCVPAASVERTNLIEEDGTSLPPGGISLAVGHHSIETLRFVPAR